MLDPILFAAFLISIHCCSFPGSHFFKCLFSRMSSPSFLFFLSGCPFLIPPPPPLKRRGIRRSRERSNFDDRIRYRARRAHIRPKGSLFAHSGTGMTDKTVLKTLINWRITQNKSLICTILFYFRETHILLFCVADSGQALAHDPRNVTAAGDDAFLRSSPQLSSS